MPYADARKLVDEVTKRLVDEGKLIEAGFAAFRIMAMSPAAPPDQIREMRVAFFGGAQHLFGSLMSVLDADAEPTAADLARMDLIHKELSEFINEFAKRGTKGTA